MDTERLSPRYSGIDTWDPSDVLDAMIDGQFSAVAAILVDPQRSLVYERSRGGHRRERSDVSIVPAGISLAHIDGNHGDQAINDVERFAPNVRVGGIVILDDFHWSSGSVKRGGARLEEMGFKPLYDIDTVSFGRVFQRVGMR